MRSLRIVDYSNSILHRASAANVQPLQNVLKPAARIILHKRMFDHITTDIRDRLHWLLFQQRIEYKACVLVYKCLHQAAPTYLTQLCSPVSESANRGHLRSTAHGDLVVPRFRTTRYGQRCFAVSGPIPWDSLPLSVRDPSCTDTDSVLCAFEDCAVL